MKATLYIFLFSAALFITCKNERPASVSTPSKNLENPSDHYDFESKKVDAIDSLLQQYAVFSLASDLSSLTPNEQKMIPILIEAAQMMDELYWEQCYGNKKWIESLQGKERAFALVNYGPWDRLNNNEPILTKDIKKSGANFYPNDMTNEEFEAWQDSSKTSQYTMIRRDKSGKLMSVPYHVYFSKQLERVSYLLEQAASLADDAGLRNYLHLRAKALISDDYQASDMAWLEMKSNKIDIVIGPIENYEDQLFGYKTSYESFVLIKDMEWSRKLEKFNAFLPELQKGLPVKDVYKMEAPGSDTELNAYDVIQYRGDCNAGSKTIAINLPNDEEVQLKKGTRRLQLKNVMKEKFEKILVPISNELLDTALLKYVNFNAFFENTMFHEVAHGLGIKNTINGKGLVRTALKEHYAALEEGKADILGLYMISKLKEKNEIQESMEAYITTFFASIFRSVRFGAGSAHGKANMIRFNYLVENGAVTKMSNGRYSIDFPKFKAAMTSLSGIILKLQGDGDYKKVAALINEKAVIKAELQKDLAILTQKSIPVDLVFKQ